MHSSKYDDATLMAYADGELESPLRDEIEKALAQDAALAQRVRRFSETAVLTREAYEEELKQPVPDALMAAVQAAIARHEPAASEAKPAAGARQASGWWQWLSGWMPAPAAMAASLVVGVLAGYAVVALRDGGDAPAPGGVVFDGREAARIASALSGSATGDSVQDAAGSVVIMHSVRDSRGNLCREFRLERTAGDAVAGVACRENKAWSIAFAQRAPAAQSGFSPASSTPALDAYLSTIGASTALSAEEESRALAEREP